MIRIIFMFRKEEKNSFIKHKNKLQFAIAKSQMNSNTYTTSKQNRIDRKLALKKWSDEIRLN